MFLVFRKISGRSTTNKKMQKNSQNSGKIFRLLKIPPILQGKFAEIQPASSTKKLVRKNL
jgi:hypothetical protein